LLLALGCKKPGSVCHFIPLRVAAGGKADMTAGR
jgi:hypothetical protein